PEEERRAAARARAEQYGWPAAVAAFLAAHRAAAVVPALGTPDRGQDQDRARERVQDRAVSPAPGAEEAR
ncbi:hypothetical protein ACFVXQ_24690, partial [Kitasatospora sp. NPDC058263]